MEKTGIKIARRMPDGIMVATDDIGSLGTAEVTDANID